MDEAYKKQAEARLEGATGCAPWEIAVITGVIFVSVALRRGVFLKIPEAVWYTSWVMLGVNTGSPAMAAAVAAAYTITSATYKSNETPPASEGFLPWLVPFRAVLMLYTIYCILAVDFSFFPEMHMKTDTYGQSLMDIGVGAFVFSHGVVMGHKVQTGHALRKWSRTSLPLAVCGVVRVMLVKALNYHEHLEEYGVHWNFFFTLAVLPGGLYILKGPPLQVTVALLSIPHFIWLQTTGTGYMLAAERHSLVDQNKEGLFSIPGFLTIFVLGCLYRRMRSKGRVLFVVFSVCLYTVLSLWVSPASRRLCNAPYVWLVASLCSATLLSLSLLPDRLCCAPFLKSVSDKSLLIFLVANLLTGGVNLTFQTLSVPTHLAHVILTCYMAASVYLGTKIPLKL